MIMCHIDTTCKLSSNIQAIIHHPSSRPTILHNPTTDEYSAQDLSDNESFGDAKDGDWDESNNDVHIDDNLLDEENVQFEDDRDDYASDSYHRPPVSRTTLHKMAIKQSIRVPTPNIGIRSAVL